MSVANFLACFNETESFEGGFVDNPHDPGGATMAGVTQATYNTWRKAMHLSPGPVKNSTAEERQDIYRMYFWNPVQGDKLFTGLDLVMVDTAWGSGPVEAIKLLQSCLKVTEDGVLGAQTLSAISNSSPTLIVELCAARLAFFQRLSTWKYFGKGWTARLAGIRVKAMAMNVGQGTVVAAASGTTLPPSILDRIKSAIEREFS